MSLNDILLLLFCVIDLRSLPRNSTVRKVNELVKRARMLKVHVHIIHHLRNQFGYFGKEKTQQRILTNLLDMFKEVQRDTGTCV